MFLPLSYLAAACFCLGDSVSVMASEEYGNAASGATRGGKAASGAAACSKAPMGGFCIIIWNRD